MRVFIGTFLGAANQTYYRDLAAAWSRRFPGVRAVPADTVHVTYAFLPNVDDQQLAILSTAVMEIATACGPVDVMMEKPGVLWAGRAPRLVDARVADGGREVMALVKKLADSITRGMPGVEHRPAKSAHVTLARFRRSASARDARDVEQSLAGEQRRDRLERIEVIRSQLAETGPVYTVVSAHPFSS